MTYLVLHRRGYTLTQARAPCGVLLLGHTVKLRADRKSPKQALQVLHFGAWRATAAPTEPRRLGLYTSSVRL